MLESNNTKFQENGNDIIFHKYYGVDFQWFLHKNMSKVYG